jgi:Fe-S oxidoreductase
MQSPEETFFAERIAAIIVPLHMARHNRKWDSARGAIPGAQVSDVHLRKNRTFCCGAEGGCFWKEEERGTKRINQERFDQISVAKPQTLAVGCPFCMTQMEDAVKSRSLEETMRVRDPSEIIAESIEAIHNDVPGLGLNSCPLSSA